MNNTDIKDKIRGSLIGGAIGDALGYPVEFMTYSQIKERYGDKGISRFQLDSKGVAEISDDTQMTLFTANGLLFGYSRGAMRGIMGTPVSYIRDSYLEWLQTQTGEIDYTKDHFNWIREIKELHSRRAPGNTCMQALADIADKKKVHNNSKGCGGIMRIAPIPLYYNARKEDYTKYHPDVFRQLKEKLHNDLKYEIKVAGDAAALTHQHPLGYLPAALLAYLIGRLLREIAPTSYQIACIISEGIELLKEIYPNLIKEINALQYLLEKAGRRAVSTLPDEEAIRQIGEGWVAEETLAIAVFCVMRYPNDFEKAILASVNHSGDSDSTGAVTGNIMGVICGYEVIPPYFKDKLELRELIEEMANDLADGIPVSEYADNYDTPEKRRWMGKYVEGIWKDKVPIKNSFLVNRELSIYAGEYPGDKDNEKCRLKILGTWSGFRYFYDLTEKGELNPYSQYLESWQQHHRFPIPDVSAPVNTKSVCRLVKEIIYHGEESKSGYGKIYIHCWGGVGRTGTIVACLYAYLLRGQHLSADEIYESAMQQLSESFSRCPKAKYRTTPETESQRLFIKKFVEKECL